MQNRRFKLDIKVPKKRHTDPDRYVIYVLWIIGYSERTIAHVMGFRTKQVAGIIGKSDFKNRSAMTDQERRMLLLEMAEIRIEDGVKLDGGRLDRIAWELLPIEGKQLRGPLRRRMT